MTPKEQNVYCKVCDKLMEIGDSMLGHIIANHPYDFANILITLNPQIISITDICFEIRPRNKLESE